MLIYVKKYAIITYTIRKGSDVMFSAREIAKWFIFKNALEQKENIAINDDYEVYEGITHLKLQKLLYYAQGVYLALENKKLFEEPLIAWDHGPVVKEVYDEYCVFGRNQIIIPYTESNAEILERIENDEKVKNVLELVYNNFAIYTAWQLREMSHVKGGPWDITPKNQKIDEEKIKEYFKKEVVEE